jgi:hypothetical protein
MSTPSVEQEIPGQTTITVDPDAPYGRKADGTPKAKPGAKPKADAPAPGVPTPPPRIPRATGVQKKTKTSTDYRPGLTGLLQVVVGPLIIAGQRNDALMADAAAITTHAPALVEAVNDLAQEQAAVAAALDRLLSAGPYGALIAAVIPLGLQIATNHGAIPVAAAKGMGVHDPAALAQAMRAQASRMAAPAAAAA